MARRPRSLRDPPAEGGSTEWSSRRLRQLEPRESAMSQDREPITLEWWPDFGGELLWLRSANGGSRISMDKVCLSPSFQVAARAWLSKYDDSRLPISGPGDAVWVAEGIQLLDAARSQVSVRYRIVVTEPWWGEPASDL